MRPEEGAGSPRSGVMDGCEPHGVREAEPECSARTASALTWVSYLFNALLTPEASNAAVTSLSGPFSGKSTKCARSCRTISFLARGEAQDGHSAVPAVVVP